MAEEKDSRNEWIRHGSWGPVVSTVLLELVGLAIAGAVALVGRAFGWLPDFSSLVLLAGVAAMGPAIERYRVGPRRLLAAITTLLSLATVTVLVAMAANRTFSALDDSDAGFLIGFLVAVPATVAVQEWLHNRADAS
ncbi:hypothetical protein [Streptomyces sp. NPDC088794]|uniref:hypothetical protein n=1 Tax=Streptomyces sp. NPDC088794 TaxID=3365902 RepID=UPI00380EBE07